MRFRVLGPTELETNGASVAIGSERQRRLLTALALHCPDTVPAERLVEAVWGDTRPANANKALATVVTRLRHTLDGHETGTGRLVVSRPPGYVLDVPVERIDANRFADLALAGRRQLAEGNVDAARRALGQALRAWHGRPYVEFDDEEWARGEAQRLERLWVAAREADVEARLASGLHAEVLGDVERLIEDEPFSDGPRALLMRALFAGGRQTEALRAFEDYRRLLAEEAGLEPGADLRELEQRVLADDPALRAPTGRPLRGYRLHERLEATDRGAIFRATQPGLEREVAIEVIREEVAADADFVRSFELQGKALAQLGHAHVVPIYDCWREPEGAYLVRRLLAGGSLADPEVRERLGPDGLARVRDQIRSALDVAHAAGLVHGPVEAGDIQLDDHDTAYLANFHLGAGDATVDDDDRSFDRLFDTFLAGTEAARARAAPSRVANPYRGLAAFAESDVDVFFGRTRLVETTLRTLDETGAAWVVGPSGSGKSSLVRAGVVPALAAGEIVGSEDWFVATMVPGSDPFAELEAAVLHVAVHPPADLRSRLADPEWPLARTIRQVLPESQATAVLVIDQFEELFILTPPSERDRFLDALGAALRDPTAPLRVIATVRADFYDQPLARPEIAPFVTEATVPVDALSGDELRAAIVEPARVVGVAVEPDLVGRLVADATAHPGALPLLQFALTQLFDARDGDTLTLDAYLATGGLAAAVGSRAEQLHDALDHAQQAACRRLFGRLVAVDATSDTRRRARLAELREAEDDPADLDSFVDRFVSARLLLTDRDPTNREPTLEVAHEALLREWPRLAGWVAEDRDTIAALRHLTTATASWRATGDDSELYRGARLAAALDLAADHNDRLTPDETAFVTASRELAEAEQRRQQRVNRRLRGLLAATGVLLVAALVAGLVANSQRSRADDQRDVAHEQRSLADAQRALADERAAVADLERLTALARSTGAVSQEVAVLAGLEAHRIAPSPDTLEALHWALTVDPSYRGTLGDTRLGGDITVLDDGRHIVAHTIDTIEVWDVETRAKVRSWPFPGSGDVSSHKLLRSTAAGDGSVLVAGAPGVTTVLDTDTGDAIATIAHSTEAVGVAVSPDATRLAIGLDDGTVEVRDLAGPGEPTATRRWADRAPMLQWQPDGDALAIGTTTGEVVLWEPATDEVRWTYPGRLALRPISSVGVGPPLLFSSDGTRLVVAGLDAPETGPADGPGLVPTGVVQLASADGSELVRDVAAVGGVRSLSWLDSAETMVVTSGQVGAHVAIVNLEDPGAVPSVRVENWEASVALPALGLIVTEAGTGLDIHSVDESNRLVRRVPLPPGTGEVATGWVTTHLDSAGSRLWTGIGFTDPHVIDLGSPGARWEPYTGTDGESVSLAFFAGDGVLTVGATGWVMRDWEGQALSDPLALPRVGISGVWLAPTGDRAVLTVGGEDVLYEIASGAREIARLGPLDQPYICCSVPTFSPDGALYSRLDFQGGTLLYDAETGERIRFPGDDELEAQLFGPQGTWFAAADERGTVHLHDQLTGERIGQPMVGNRGDVSWMLPTPDNRRMAVVGADGSTRVWDLETTTQVGRQIDTTHPGHRSWSGDGRFFSSYVMGDDSVGRIEVWNFDTDTWLDAACELAGRNMTEDEWEQFGPRTIERRATCPEYPLP